MKERCQQLYQALLKELKECSEKGLSLQKETENCFNISNKYWAAIRHDVSQHQFETVKEEVHFFKHLKPLFTSHIEFYGLYYHALLYKQEMQDNVEQMKQFWTRESTRLEKFINENQYFYEYYIAGSTNMDTFFYTRAGNETDNLLDLEPDAKDATSHGHLIASILALGRYNEYVLKELQALGAMME